MNVTFLLGNGFDLQLGMATGYKSFLEWYVEMPSNDPDIAQFREFLKDEKGEWWSDAEVAMGNYLGNFSDSNISIYFKNIRDFKLRLYEYLEYENLRYHIIDEEKVETEFKKFILHSDEDVMLRKSNLHLGANRKHNHLYVNFITFNYTNALDLILDVVQKQNKILETNNSYESRVGKVYHVHGTLDSSLIMGVDNFAQLDTTNILDQEKLQRTLIKPIVNDELGRDEHTNAIKLIQSSNYLVFYGLSFGITDMTWWESVREKLIADINCQVILFTRSKASEIQTIIPEDLLDYVSMKRTEFLTKIGITSDSEYYDNIRKRIFIIRNTEKLNIAINDMKELIAK